MKTRPPADNNGCEADGATSRRGFPRSTHGRGGPCVLALCGILIVVADGRLTSRPQIAVAGFAIILATASVQLAMARSDWLRLEESLAPVGAILIIGLGPQRVTILSILWLAAVACGVIARGGRVYWVGRDVLLIALVLPIAASRRSHSPTRDSCWPRSRCCCRAGE